MRSSSAPALTPAPARIAAAVLILALAGSAGATERLVDRIAAVVNDEVIALSEVYDVGSQYIAETCPGPYVAACREEAERWVLDALVRRNLQRQELIRVGADVTQAEVDQLINQTVVDNGFADREALRDEVEKAGYSWEIYRKQQIEEPLRDRRFQEVVLRSRVAIAEDELRDQYQRLIRDLEAPERVSLSAFGYVLPQDLTSETLPTILTSVRSDLDRVRAGELTWPALLETWDTAGLAPLVEGQDFERGDLNDAIADVAFATEEGAIAEPVISGGILYGVNVLTRTRGELEVPTFEAVQDQLGERVFVDKLEQAAEEWFQVAQRRAAIRFMVGEPELEPEPEPEPDPADDDG